MHGRPKTNPADLTFPPPGGSGWVTSNAYLAFLNQHHTSLKTVNKTIETLKLTGDSQSLIGLSNYLDAHSDIFFRELQFDFNSIRDRLDMTLMIKVLKQLSASNLDSLDFSQSLFSYSLNHINKNELDALVNAVKNDKMTINIKLPDEYVNSHWQMESMSLFQINDEKSELKTSHQIKLSKRQLLY